jgi:hypothetical protein
MAADNGAVQRISDRLQSEIYTALGRNNHAQQPGMTEVRFMNTVEDGLK